MPRPASKGGLEYQKMFDRAYQFQGRLHDTVLHLTPRHDPQMLQYTHHVICHDEIGL